eukprot:CAMPEP_0184738060 /NCGR_PEP_ID=MMETSP0315-20130426/808_1 /TAXON_ID=101924 /ORGANISM="Rhodosorus marinus, Strain UTEX LB 2760" /LENGTH=38 /DNA_ID= /DNA_START= /DNA_END= /DNA_ORIENTATION=
MAPDGIFKQQAYPTWTKADAKQQNFSTRDGVGVNGVNG